jgi:hypothetical protein
MAAFAEAVDESTGGSTETPAVTWRSWRMHQAFVHYAADAVGASVADESESGTYGRCLIDGAPI